MRSDRRKRGDDGPDVLYVAGVWDEAVYTVTG